LNKQREAAFQTVEEDVERFQKMLLLEPSPPIRETDQQMGRYMACGIVTFQCQTLQLGKFTAPNHAGNSIKMLEARLRDVQSIKAFKDTNLFSRYSSLRDKIAVWDMTEVLKITVNNLGSNTWSLDYNDFKLPAVAHQATKLIVPSKDPDN
jgi:hypothetical protein